MPPPTCAHLISTSHLQNDRRQPEEATGELQQELRDSRQKSATSAMTRTYCGKSGHANHLKASDQSNIHSALETRSQHISICAKNKYQI